MSTLQQELEAAPGVGSEVGGCASVRETVRRHFMLMLAVGCVLSSAVFLAAPLLGRWYELSGTIRLSVPTFAQLPELATIAKASLVDVERGSAGGRMRATVDEEAEYQRVVFNVGGSRRDAAWVELQREAEQFATAAGDRVRKAVGDYRSGLRKSADQLAAKELTMTGAMEAFRLAHRGALPDDPTSILGQLEKLSSKLDERQERLQVVSRHITGLQELKKNGGAAGSMAPLPGPDGRASPTTTVAANLENDPEVFSLKAQLQLISDQLSEQLGTMGRTEQHPYVVELRAKESELRKKLDAAKTRAAAGEPAPVESRTGGAAVVGVTAVDLQLESLQAERDALDAEVRGLAAQRDVLQKQADDVMPVRQEFVKLTEELAGVKKDRAAAKGQLEELDRRFPETGAGGVEISPLAVTTGSMLPVFPRLPMIYAAGLGAAMVVVLLLAWILKRMDRSFHTAREAALLGAPILGAVSEIRSARQRRRRRLWMAVGRPAAMAGLVALAVVSAALCYRELSDPHFRQFARDGATSSLTISDNVGG